MNNDKEYTITDIYNKIDEIERNRKEEKILSIIITVVMIALGIKVIK